MSFDVLLYGDPIYYLVTVRAYIKVRELSQSQREFQIQSGADLIGPRCCNHVLFEQLLIAQWSSCQTIQMQSHFNYWHWTDE